ncbi:unnamed protein product [Prorocentrum cordatum]|nr:unnamed protein product [Polarella glacialis]
MPAGSSSPDLLKVDVDHSDCRFMEEALRAVRPKLIHLEFMPLAPPPLDYAQRYQPTLVDVRLQERRKPLLAATTLEPRGVQKPAHAHAPCGRAVDACAMQIHAAASAGRGAGPDSEADQRLAEGTPSSWVTSAWGDCMSSCDLPVKHRDVACASPVIGEAPWSCSCELEVCKSLPGTACGAPEDPMLLGLPSYVEVGCFQLSVGDPGVTCAGDYDTTCLSWRQGTPCKSGFPFFSNCSGGPAPAMRAAECFNHCITRGLDMFAIVEGLECRCGASMLSTAVWRQQPPGAGKAFSIGASVQSANATAGECSLQVFRYAGSYDAGYVPLLYVTSANVAVGAYIDSIVAGTVVSPEKEEETADEQLADLRPTLGDLAARAARLSGNASSARSSLGKAACATPFNQYGYYDCDDAWWKDQYSCADLEGFGLGIDCTGCQCPGDWPSSRDIPGWTRNCYPLSCGYGEGPWPTRQATAPAGVPDLWDEYVIIPYKFVSGFPAESKAVVETAAKHWYDQTCIVFQETTPDSYLKVEFTNADPNQCYATVIGKPVEGGTTSQINMGWCNSAAHTGNVIHELGHALGMVHEQQRPDGSAAYHGRGPHLVIRWENIDSSKYSQYTAKSGSYTGSAHDGDGDAHEGYSPYDFGSVVHYGAGASASPKFTALPEDVSPISVGQRVGLPAMDISQALDTYQCRANDASRLAKGFAVVGPFCSDQSALATEYVLGGETQDKKPWYVSADGAYYLYYDPDCDGQGSAPRWVFDAQQPSETATSDLDGDAACDYEATNHPAPTDPSVEIWRGVPLGRSTFLMMCGNLGWQNQEVTVTGIEPLTVSGHCQDSVDGYFAGLGSTASGSPYYGNGKGTYLYYDPDCSGAGTRSPAWHFDAAAPSTVAAADLSGTGDCEDLGYVESGNATAVPTGTSSWQERCQDGSGAWAWGAKDLTVEEAALPPTPPPTPHPECSDTDGGATDSTGQDCAAGYSYHYAMWCGECDSSDFTASTAVGDPHITNLLGESFDVNKPGEHALLRVPFDDGLSPQLEVRARMKPATASPCGLWITEVIFSGEWVGEEVRVHTAAKAANSRSEPDHFALLVGPGADHAVRRRWRRWSKFPKGADVSLSGNVTVRPTFRDFQGAAAVKGRRVFEFLVGPSASLQERVSITVAQASKPALSTCRSGKGSLVKQLLEHLLGPHYIALTQEPVGGIHRFRSSYGDVPRVVSCICLDHFFLRDKIKKELNGHYDTPEALDHEGILVAASAERSDSLVSWVLVEGFMAFYDARLYCLCHVRIWLELPVAVAWKRRAKTKRVKREYFDLHIWPNHVTYRELVFSRPGASQQIGVLDATHRARRRYCLPP